MFGGQNTIGINLPNKDNNTFCHRIKFILASIDAGVRERLAPQNIQHLKANTIFTTQMHPHEQSPVSVLNIVGFLAVPFQGCSDNVFVKRSSYRSSNKRTNPEDPLQCKNQNLIP